MKTLKTLLVAGFALGATAFSRADVSAAVILETYYLNPQPDALPRVIRELSRDRYFEQPGHTALAIGFISTIFAQNPDRVDHWLLELNGLPLKANRLLAAALWQAGHPIGPALLLMLGQFSPLRAELERLVNTPVPPIVETAVRSSSSLSLQWGAFFASGDERHLLAMFDAVGLGDANLQHSIRVSLTQAAAVHPRVREICREQLERQPEEVREVLRAALAVVA